MLTTLMLMAAGLGAGYLLRGNAGIVKMLNPVINVAIVILLFLLGLAVGSNDLILSNIPGIGWRAFCLTIGALTGSVLLAYLTYKKLFSKDES